MNHACDFSTDVRNSDLIVTTKYSLRIAIATPTAKQQQQEFCLQDWFTWEGTPCHGGRFLVVNSLLQLHYHPRP
jgi:hypothetical protein